MSTAQDFRIVASGARGGLRLDAHKERSTALPISPLSAPQIATLPLNQHAGRAALPVVAVGERVRMAQAVACPDGEISAWLHAPVSGIVTAIEPRSTPYPSASEALCIVIENDQSDDRLTYDAVDFETLTAAQLREHIGRGGIVGLGGAAFPAQAKLDTAESTQPLRLLLNGAECEPYISCDEMLMRERAPDIVFGARVLMHALEASECVIALEADAPAAAQALRAAIAEDARIRLAIVPTIYPAGGERQLIAATFGREVPFDGLPAYIGIVCQNVGTAAAVARWVRDGEPLITRIVTITGDGVQQPRNLEVRIGTPIAQAIEQCGGYTPRVARLIMGGTMMGIALSTDELPIVKATNCILAASTLDLQPRAPEMPCIRCGACSEVCPAMLLPQQIHWNARVADLAGLERYGLMDCIECGCCDYVCPSQIPLTQRFREAKPLLARELQARGRATDARLQYESRHERLQRVEQEQREKLRQKRQRT